MHDVLRPITEPSQYPTHTLVTALPAREQLSLKEITVRVNGQIVSAPASWMIGAAARIDIPGHGAYVIAAYDPRGSQYRFFPNVIASGESLIWSIDGDDLEITSKTAVLTAAISGTIWVSHDRSFWPQAEPNTVRLQTADTLEWLLPKQ